MLRILPAGRPHAFRAVPVCASASLKTIINRFLRLLPSQGSNPFYSYTKEVSTHKSGCLLLYGVLGGIRTPDPLVRSQILYPTELQAHIIKLLFCSNPGFYPFAVPCIWLRQ